MRAQLRRRNRYSLPLLESLEGRQLLSGGLDVSFNANGKKVVPFDLGGTNIDEAHASARANDGSYIVVGTIETQSKKTNFGIARIPESGGLPLVKNYDVAENLQPDGAQGVAVWGNKIVVVGYVRIPKPGAPNDTDIAVMRLDQNLEKDPTFNGGMPKIIEYNPDGSGPLMDEATSVVVDQATGDIYVGGFSYHNTTNHPGYLTVTKVKVDGSLDPQFDPPKPGWTNPDQKGRAVIKVGPYFDFASTIQIQGGKILVGGLTSNSPDGNDSDSVLAMLTPLGTLDTQFGLSGIKRINFSPKTDGLDTISGLKWQSDGTILVSGEVQQPDGSYDFGIAKLSADGRTPLWQKTYGFDLNFNGTRNDFPRGMTVDSKGRIVVAGYSDDQSSTNTYMSVLRLNNSDGSLDTSFGENGSGKVSKATIQFGTAAAEHANAFGVITDPQDRIILAGWVDSTTGGRDFAVARLVGNDPVPTSVSMLVSAKSVGEGDGSVVLTVRRSGDTSFGLPVSYLIQPAGANPATEGLDYRGAGGTVTIPAGQTQTTIVVQILEDTSIEPNETFRVILQKPPGDVTLGTPSFTDVMIVDNDQPPVIEFEQESVSVFEAQRSVRLTVVRSGDLSQALTIPIRYGNVTAIPGFDYQTQPVSVTMLAGQSRASFDIPIVDDAVAEDTESFVVSLGTATGFIVGGRGSATITITDDDPVVFKDPIQPKTRNKKVVGFVISFTAALDKNSASDPANYQLSIGKKKLAFSPSYTQGSKQVNISLRNSLGRRQTIKIVIKATLLDSWGHPLANTPIVRTIRT